LGFDTFGGGGVDIFFVISGFIMVYTTQSHHVGPFSFFVNRVVRIVPIYWLLTLAVFTLAVIAPHLLGATRAAPSELLKSLLFIPFAKSNGAVQPILFLGWTLNYEMFFYMLFALGPFSENAQEQ
jgi:exopolysaccharide production protein ExoZ